MGFKLIRTKSKNGFYDTTIVDSTYILEDKINYYVSWYEKNIGKYSTKELRDTIEKVAIWYELRYPDIYLDQGDVDSVMFKDVNLQEGNQQWCDFYNFKKFYYSLSEKERRMIDKPVYPELIYLYGDRGLHIHLEKDGTILDTSDLFWCRKNGSNSIVTNNDIFGGHNIREMEAIAKENELDLRMDNVTRIVNYYQKSTSIRDGLFDSILYRIIEKGGKYYGPRRGVLFAREFGKNIDIPVSYGDASLALEYLANDGNEDLLCLVNYFDSDKVVKKSIKEILSNQNLTGLSGKQKMKVFPKTDI